MGSHKDNDFQIICSLSGDFIYIYTYPKMASPNENRSSQVSDVNSCIINFCTPENSAHDIISNRYKLINFFNYCHFSEKIKSTVKSRFTVVIISVVQSCESSASRTCTQQHLVCCMPTTCCDIRYRRSLRVRIRVYHARRQGSQVSLGPHWHNTFTDVTLGCKLLRCHCPFYHLMWFIFFYMTLVQ